MDGNAMLHMKKDGKNVLACTHPGGNPVLFISGNDNVSIFQIENSNDSIIASVSRANRSIKKKLTRQRSYVGDSVSPSLMAFVVIAIDDFFC